jgi:hypothetical protein
MLQRQYIWLLCITEAQFDKNYRRVFIGSKVSLALNDLLTTNITLFHSLLKFWLLRDRDGAEEFFFA